MEQQKTSGDGDRSRTPVAFIFPAWTNFLGPLVALGVLGGAVVATGIVWYYFSPKFTDVGYAPKQPLAYSHKLHANDMGIDCRYCHANVERSPVASVPPSQVCMNCHLILPMNEAKREKFKPVRESYETGNPVPWVRVHATPDYAYFDHSRHVNRGVGCVSCHGRVDQMERVYQVEPLSMSWCLDCHRNPAPNLRPVESVTDMAWKAPGGDAEAFGKQLMAQYKINPPTDCSGCHR